MAKPQKVKRANSSSQQPASPPTSPLTHIAPSPSLMGQGPRLPSPPPPTSTRLPPSSSSPPPPAAAAAAAVAPFSSSTNLATPPTATSPPNTFFPSLAHLNFDSSMAASHHHHHHHHGPSSLLHSPPGSLSPSSSSSLQPRTRFFSSPGFGGMVQHEDFVEIPSSGEGPALLSFGKIPPSLLCPAHKGLLFDPCLVVVCGHTLCRRCIEKVVQQSSSPQCPVDHKPMTEKDMVPNLAIADQISELLILCPNGSRSLNDHLAVDPEGCQEIIKFGQLEEHQHHCQFALVACPNSDQCEKIQRRSVGIHLETCRRTPCPNKSSGCRFEAHRREIEKHLGHCQFRLSSNSKFRSEGNLETFENGQLRKMVEDLNERVKTLEEQLILSRQTTSALANEVERERANTSKILDQFHEHLRYKVRIPTVPMYKVSSGNNHRNLQNAELEMPFSFNLKGTFVTFEEQVWCLHYANNYLVSGGSKGTIKYWDLNEHRCVNTLKAHEGIIYALASGGGLLYTGGEDCMIRSFRLDSFEEHQSIKSGQDAVSSMVVTDRFLITGSLATIRVWNCLNFRCEHVLSGLAHWVWVRALALDEKKTRLFSGTHNAIQVWDTATFTCLQTINTSYGSIYSLILTSRFLICGTYNQNIHLYELKNQGIYEHLQPLTGHIGTIRTLQTSNSGKFLFSGSVDSTVMIWNLENFLCIQTLYRHSESVNALAYRNGILFSGSSDQSIMIYEAR